MVIVELRSGSSEAEEHAIPRPGIRAIAASPTSGVFQCDTQKVGRACLIGIDPQLVVESPLERSKEVNGLVVVER